MDPIFKYFLMNDLVLLLRDFDKKKSFIIVKVIELVSIYSIKFSLQEKRE